MEIDADRYAVYAAIADDGDFDEAVAALHRLPAGAPRRGDLAAKLIALRIRDGGLRHISDRGHTAEQVQGLIALADGDPPASAEWPQQRAVAKSWLLMAAAASGSPTTPAEAISELEGLAAVAGDDPAVAKLLGIAQMMLGNARSFDDGDASTPLRLKEDAESLRAMAPGNQEVAGLAEYLVGLADIQLTQQRGGDVFQAMQDLYEKVSVLPPDHPIRTTMDESMATVGPLSRFLSRTPDPSGPPSPEEIAAAEELAARTDGDADTRALRHASVGGLLLNGMAETDPDRVGTAVEHFRAAVMLSPRPDGPRAALLTGFALALFRRNELTNTMADLDEAARTLAEARELAGGPRHPAWSLINDMTATVQRRRGESGTRDTALDSLRGTTWQVLVQNGVSAAKYAARDAARDAIDTARSCLIDGAPGDAVRALDAGRGLMLYAATEFREVASRLEDAGHPELAERWRKATAEGAPELLPAGLRGDVVAALADVARLLDPPDAAEIGEALADLEADALVYLVPADGGHPGWGVVVAADGRLTSVALANLAIGSGLESERYLSSLANRDLAPQSRRADLADSLEALCDWAWRVAMGPIVEQVLPTLPAPADGRPHRLVLVPMGELALIPWQAARSRDGRYALEFAAFSQAASARMLCRSAAAEPVRAVPVGLVVGDPDTEGLAPPLPSARLEAFAVHQAFYRGGRYIGQRPDGTPSPAGAGTADEVRAWLGRPQPGAVLHLACHGVVDTAGEEATSYLLLAGDSRITAQEIVDRAARLPDGGIALAVLAACRTGRSIHGYDEAYSLGTAFLAGGVRSVLSTLWSVPDDATSVLMFMFHHYLCAEGRPAWEALHRAQLWMLDPGRQLPEGMPGPLRRRFDAERAVRAEAWAGFVHWGR